MISLLQDCEWTMNNEMKPCRDPFPGEKWEIRYEDTFDRETPISIDKQGTGLLMGIVELWKRHLKEGTTPAGGRTFSRFWLNWQNQTIMIPDNKAGAAKLRGWAIGEGSVNRKLLERLGCAHISFVDMDRAAGFLLERADSTEELEAFEAWLDEIITS